MQMNRMFSRIFVKFLNPQHYATKFSFPFYGFATNKYFNLVDTEIPQFFSFNSVFWCSSLVGFTMPPRWIFISNLPRSGIT